MKSWVIGPYVARPRWSGWGTVHGPDQTSRSPLVCTVSTVCPIRGIRKRPAMRFPLGWGPSVCDWANSDVSRRRTSSRNPPKRRRKAWPIAPEQPTVHPACRSPRSQPPKPRRLPHPPRLERHLLPNKMRRRRVRQKWRHGCAQPRRPVVPDQCEERVEVTMSRIQVRLRFDCLCAQILALMPYQNRRRTGTPGQPKQNVLHARGGGVTPDDSGCLGRP